MVIEIEVNGQVLKAKKGDILLDVLNQNGIRVPTLCSMEGFPATGACRICVVEVEGKQDLVPACSFPIEEWMKVQTHSARVILARRTIVELLISNHPDDCLYCFQNKHCELQRLSTELRVTERKARPSITKFKIDRTSPAIVHDPTKCVLCGRCIRICDDLTVSALEFISRGNELRVGTVGNRGLSHSNCISCGQCIQACPTGSLQEKSQMEELINQLHEKTVPVVALIDPALVVSIGEELGFRSGKDVSGHLYSALRKIGFAEVHSGSEMADVSIFITAKLWQEAVKDSNHSHSIVSFCPSWNNYIEKLRPDLLDNILPVYTPPQIFGRLFRDKKPDAFIVYFSPCIGAKMEEKSIENQLDGKPFVNAVLSTRELVQLIQLFGIDFERMPAEVPDTLLNAVYMSGLLTAVSGGYLEGLSRALWVLDADNYPLKKKIPKLRGVKVCKSEVIDNSESKQRWTACSSLSTALDLIDTADRSKYHELLEITTCQGGCLNGGGQPGLRNDKTTRLRIKEIYDSDEDLSGQLSAFADRVIQATSGLQKTFQSKTED